MTNIVSTGNTSKKPRSLVTLTFICTFVMTAVFGQSEIPIGSWRAHLSFNTIISIAETNDLVYAASPMGIVVFDKNDGNISTLSKLNGLSGSGISYLAYDPVSQQLIITYDDGDIDLIHDNVVTNFPRLKDLSNIAGSKRINHVAVRGNLAYLATSYGIVVFDLVQQEIRETWRDLGSNGTNVRVNQIAFLSDSIAAATQDGVIVGSLHDNLLDFAKWERYNTGDFNRDVRGIVNFAGTIYAGIDTLGIYRYGNHHFEKQTFLAGSSISSLESSAQNLIVASDGKLWLYNLSKQLIQVADDMIPSPITAKQDEDGVLWVADSLNGLVSNIDGTFQAYLPNGPSFLNLFRLARVGQKLYALNGGYGTTREPLGNSGVADFFENGVWKRQLLPAQDITDAALFENNFFFSSFGQGLVRQDAAGAIVIFDETNSPLSHVNSTVDTYVSALETSPAGLWVANYGATTSLHLLKPDNTWQSFASNPYPTGIVVDPSGNVWMAIDPLRGGGIAVLDPVSGSTVFRNDVAGSGGLLNRNVRSLAVDRDGNVWVGTDAGLGYFYSKTQDAVIPIYEDRFLLRDEKITAIEVDGGNRKWIGTEHGVWVMSATGETLVHHFTAANSPLFSDVITDIDINHESGEVFLGTDKGIVSFRADATAGLPKFDKVKIFPNPVTSDFTGVVGITGLATDAVVKITDVSGKLIWQVQANGGTAIWNVRDYNGRRAQTGIYLVFASSQDGRESAVGKIAIVD